MGRLRVWPHRVAPLPRTNLTWDLYTDTSYELGQAGARMAAIPPARQIARAAYSGPLTRQKSRRVRNRFLHATSVFFGLGMASAVLEIYYYRSQLLGKSIAFYIDNNAAPASIINGDSSSAASFSLIATLWLIVAARDISIWSGRAE